MVSGAIDAGLLGLEMRGADKPWSLRSHLDIPLRSVGRDPSPAAASCPPRTARARSSWPWSRRAASGSRWPGGRGR
jgi:hypothetical protein